MKNFSRQVFGFFACTDAACDKGVNPVKILLIQFREVRGLPLCCLDQEPVIGFALERINFWF